MVKWEVKLDRNAKIYIAKPIRRSGIDNVVEMQHFGSVLIVYKKGTPISEIINSLRTHIMDLEVAVCE